MKNMEKIIDRIELDAKAAIAGIEGKSREVCEGIAAEAAQKASQIYEDLMAKGQKSAEEKLGQIKSNAMLEAKKSVLAKKQELISRAFDEALKKINAISGEEYIGLTARLIADSCTTGKERIILSGEDRNAYGAQIIAKANELLKTRIPDADLILSEKTGAFSKGAVISNGKVEQNCSMEALIRDSKHQLSGKVANILFMQ